MPKGRRPTDRDPPSLMMTRLDSTVCGLWVTVLFYMYFQKEGVVAAPVTQRACRLDGRTHVAHKRASARAVLRRYA